MLLRAWGEFSPFTWKVQQTQVWTTQGIDIIEIYVYVCVRACVRWHGARMHVSISHEVCIRGTVVYPKLMWKLLRINRQQSKYPSSASRYDLQQSTRHASARARANIAREHWLTLLFNDEVKWQRNTKSAARALLEGDGKINWRLPAQYFM